MQLYGNWLLAERLVSTALYKLLRLAFITVQRIYWYLNGTSQRQRDARLSHNYEWSAQVLDVVLFHKFCAGQTTTVDNFLCTHNRFENPQYIIDNDNITLMIITERDAVFCETEQKGMHLWRGEYSPFIREAQTEFCRHLIVVPLSTFHRLSELIGDPQGQLIFLFNTGRCGSTFITQMMEYTERCVAVSEPNALDVVIRQYRKLGDSPELRQLTRDLIRWECRPYPTIQPPPLGYFVKPPSGGILLLQFFRDLFPTSRCLFMYRDVVAVAKSFYRLSMVLPTIRLNYLHGYFYGQMTINYISLHCGRLDSHLTSGVVLWALIMSMYLDTRRRGFDVSAVRYEDLVEHPLDMCRVVLEYCRLPTSLAPFAVRAFDVDSQRSSLLAKSVMGRFKEPQLTSHRKTKTNELLKKYGLPLIDEPGIVEGTLSPSQ